MRKIRIYIFITYLSYYLTDAIFQTFTKFSQKSIICNSEIKDLKVPDITDRETGSMTDTLLLKITVLYDLKKNIIRTYLF